MPRKQRKQRGEEHDGVDVEIVPIKKKKEGNDMGKVEHEHEQDVREEEEYEDDDDEEFQGLLSSSSREPDGSSDQQGTIIPERAKRRRQTRNVAAVVVWKRPVGVMVAKGMAMVLSVGAVVWLVRFVLILEAKKHERHHHKDTGSSGDGHLDPTSTALHNGDSVVITESHTASVDYACPTHVDKASNDKDDVFDFYTIDTERHSATTLSSSNKTIHDLLNMDYGAWGITPNQRKALDAHWVHWYADAIHQAVASRRRSHDNENDTPITIYESACGVGLTLYVILELLAERYNITGLEVYGNEYIADDVVTANQFYLQLEQEQSSQQQASTTTSSGGNFPVQLGRICHGDSTHLADFVPANAFDVVMTGYIDPIVDPLNLGISHRQHKKYCKNPKKSKLMAKEQAAVEDWFASWVTEMIRIAKPGSIIVVESISPPQCQVGDWGGVSKEWWTAAATMKKYGWDIERSLTELVDFDPAAHYKRLHDRYNVKLVKKKQPETRRR